MEFLSAVLSFISLFPGPSVLCPYTSAVCMSPLNLCADMDKRVLRVHVVLPRFARRHPAGPRVFNYLTFSLVARVLSVLCLILDLIFSTDDCGKAFFGLVCHPKTFFPRVLGFF